MIDRIDSVLAAPGDLDFDGLLTLVLLALAIGASIVSAIKKKSINLRMILSLYSD